MKQKIFIDFDGTVFNTFAFKKDLFAIYKKAGYKEEEIEKTYWDECLDYKYSIEGNLKRLANIRKYDEGKIDPEVERVYAKVPSYLYKDTVPFLKKINHSKYEVNLLSLGDIGFQRLKVDHSGLEKYFDNIYITDKQKWDYLADFLPTESFFVFIDDRADTVENIGKKFPNSVPLRILRNDFDHDDPYIELDCKELQIGKLTEALKYF